MSLSARELWTVIHGMVLGAVFLLAFGGGIAGLWSLRPELVTPVGIKERMLRLILGTWTMAIVAWLTVITGTWIVYPWYRAKAPAGANLSEYPKAFLVADPSRAGWHNFGMEWKEHIAWLCPILATAVAYVVIRYRARLATEPKIREALEILFTIAFVSAAVAGLFGAFINKVAPIR